MSSYIPIASQTLGSSAASVTFSSIPTTLNGKTLRDLVLVCYGFGTVDGVATWLRFNSDSGANYNIVAMTGNGSSATSGFSSSTNQIAPDASFAQFGSTVPGQVTFNIMDFAQTNKHKSVLLRWDRADFRTNATAARWANTSAITSLQVFASSNAWTAGSTFNLYGLEG